MIFSRLVQMFDILLFFAYWFLDMVSPIKEAQKPLDLFRFIFQYLPSLFDLFTFFYFSIFIAIYSWTHVIRTPVIRKII